MAETRPLFRLARSYAPRAQDRQWLSVKNLIWLLAALAVGLFVRVNELASQSLWNDEGTSVALAQTSVSAIVNAAARDIHPPLYYLLLSSWIPAAGISEFAVRFLSVLAGVLVIALTFRIAREFFDQDVAVIAAVLAALNPFQTYYAQETRMYIWVTLFSAASVWMMALMFNPPRQSQRKLETRIRRRALALAAYVLVTLAALYTHYYAFTLVLFENLAFAAWLGWARRHRRLGIGHSLAFWIAAQVVISLAYLPWLVFASASLTAWPGISQAMSLPEMAWRILSAFVTASDTLAAGQLLLVAAYGLFFISGLLPSRDLFLQSSWGIVTCALWAVVPFLAMYFVSLARPAYNPKFLLLATPGFMILVARGVSVLYPGLFLRERTPYPPRGGSAGGRVSWQVISIAKLFVGALFAAGTVLALQALFTDPRLQRDDYRGIVNYINAVATDRDTVVVNAPGQMDVVRYYYKGAAELKAIPIGRPLDPEATNNALVQVLNRAERVYGIFWATEQADPEAVVETKLALDGFKASEEWHGNVRLAQYASPSAFRPESVERALVKFGDELVLDGYSVGKVQAAGGDIVPIWAAWETLEPPRADYHVFFHLLDRQGRIVSQRDARLDNAPGDLTFLPEGVSSESRHGLVIQPGTPPGDYTLIMGLYRPDTGERLPASTGGDHIELGTISVTRTATPLEALFLTRRISADFGAVRGLGYNLERSRFKPGEFVPLVLYWYAHSKPSADLSIQVQLLDSNDHSIASQQAFQEYPSTRWDASQVVRDPLNLVIPGDAAPGEYKIVVTDGMQTFDVARIEVGD